VNDVDHDHGTPTASNRLEKNTGIDSTQQNTAMGDFLSRSVKVEMLNGDTEVSPLLAAMHDAREDESPPFSEVRPNFPFNPSPITQPSIQESEEGEKEDNQQRMISSTNAEYTQSQSGVYLSVPLAATTTHTKSLTFNTDYSEGYDSDGEIGPFFDAVQGEEEFDDDDSDDDSIFFFGAGFSSPAVVEPEATLPSTVDAADATDSSPPTKETLMLMTNNALKTMCKDRGLAINGNKQVLVQRLPTNPNGRPKKDNAAPPRAVTGENEEENAGFHPDAKWRELVHSSVPVEEPRRPNRLVGPTAYKENEKEAQKFNFSETFDRPPFTVMAEEYTERKGKTPKRQCAPRLEKKVIEHGRANLDWLKKNKLTEHSHPSDWFLALLPEKRVPEQPNHLVSIADWTTFTNKKAMLANAWGR
jgi:hypothetical protein